MEVVVSVSAFVVDRRLNSSIRNPYGDVQKGEFYFKDSGSELKYRVEACDKVNKGFQFLSPARSPSNNVIDIPPIQFCSSRTVRENSGAFYFF